MRALLVVPSLLVAFAVCAAPAPAQSWGSLWNDYHEQLLWGDHPWSQRRVQPLPTVVEREVVDTQVVPLLAELLASHKDERLRAVAAWALGEVAGPDSLDAVGDALLAALKDTNDTVRARAALALGVAYVPERGPDLVELARDSDAGRRLVRNEPLEDAVRTAAITALGAARDPAHAPALMELFASLDDKRHDFRAAAARALGRCGGDSEEVAEFLLDQLGDHWLEESVRAAVARAVAELGHADTLDGVVKVLGKSNLDEVVVASAVIAVGEVAEPSDRKAVKLLVKEAFKNSNANVRARALMGVTLLLARDEDPGGNKSNHETFADELEDQLDKPKFRTDGGLHALAAGFYARAHPERGEDLMELVRERLDDIKDPRERGAYALALGLAPQEGAGEELFDLFDDVKQPNVRAALAEALGLLGHQPAREALLAELGERGRAAGLLGDCALSLMLLDAAGAEQHLRTLIAENSNVETRAALISALGGFRTEAAVRALAELLADEKLDDATRRAACGALGRAATARVVSWAAPY